MKENHFVYITTYGDDWSDEERVLVHTTEDLRRYESKEYREGVLCVSGIRDVNIEIKVNVSDTELRETLTVQEYCDLYPEVKLMIDIAMTQIEKNEKEKSSIQINRD